MERDKEKMLGGYRRNGCDTWVPFGSTRIRDAGRRYGCREGWASREEVHIHLPVFSFLFVFGEIGKVPSSRKDGCDPGITVRKRGHEVDQKLAGGWLSSKDVIWSWFLARSRPACVGVCEQFSVVLGPQDVEAEQFCGWPGTQVGLEAERRCHSRSCRQERGLG